MSKVSRRGLFGLAAGAAALPLAPKALAAPQRAAALQPNTFATYQRYSGYAPITKPPTAVTYRLERGEWVLDGGKVIGWIP